MTLHREPVIVDASFHYALGSSMVLQQAPARAAIFGEVRTVAGGMSGEPSIFVHLRHMPGRKSASRPHETGYGLTHIASISGKRSGLNGTLTWQWLAHLAPVEPTEPASLYEIVASASEGGAALAKLSHVAFGDVWVCAGQSNMEVPTSNSFGLQNATAAIRAGQYANVRLASIWRDPNAPPTSNRWLAPRASLDATDAVAQKFGAFGAFCATCWYYAQELTDRFLKAHLVPPALGLVCIAAGQSLIERWTPPGQLQQQCAHTSSGTADGDLYRERIQPLTALSIKGWLWHQGKRPTRFGHASAHARNAYACVLVPTSEHASCKARARGLGTPRCADGAALRAAGEHNLQTNAISGNSLGGYGYGCELPTLVALWRQEWSAVANTTDPLAPFGVVTLHPRAGWMGAYDFGGFRWSQTANYGRLPNPAMPRTFLAHAYDLADPWNLDNVCYWADCCGPRFGCDGTHCRRSGHEDPAKCRSMTALTGGPDACENYCRVLGRTPMTVPSLGPLHSRLHQPIGARLAAAAARAVYGVGTHSAEGPTIAGCAVVGAARGDRLVLTFNQSLLSGEALVLRPPRHARGSMFEVLVNESQFCLQPMQRCMLNPNASTAAPRHATNASFVPRGSVNGPLGKLLGTGNADPQPPRTICEPDQREFFCPHALGARAVDSPRVERRLADFSFVGGRQMSYLPPLPAADGWVSLNMSMTGPYELSVDLTPLHGATVHAVRYAWGVRSYVSPGRFEEPLCCAASNDPQLSISKPCEPASCPIIASGGLPANPFMARVVHGRCKCLSPQVCDFDPRG